MASQGPNSPVTVVSSGGTQPWSNPGNAVSSNNSYATIGVFDIGNPGNLKSTEFGFAVPTGATITGIEARIEYKADSAGPYDHTVSLIRAGITEGTNKATGAAIPTSETVVTYGGASDLWGATWTPTDINDTGFGLLYRAFHDDVTPITVSVDHVTLTVYYAGAPDPRTPKKTLTAVRPRRPWSGQLFTIGDILTPPDPTSRTIPPHQQHTALRMTRLRGQVALGWLERNPAASTNPIRRPVVIRPFPLPIGSVLYRTRLLRPDPVVVPQVLPRPLVLSARYHLPNPAVVRLSRVPGPTPEVVPTPRPQLPRVIHQRRLLEQAVVVLVGPPSPGAPIAARPPHHILAQWSTQHRRLNQGRVIVWRPMRDIYIEPPTGDRVPKRTLIGVDV